MDLPQLGKIVAPGESETLEFKKTTGERRVPFERKVPKSGVHATRRGR